MSRFVLAIVDWERAHEAGRAWKDPCAVGGEPLGARGRAVPSRHRRGQPPGRARRGRGRRGSAGTMPRQARNAQRGGKAARLPHRPRRGSRRAGLGAAMLLAGAGPAGLREANCRIIIFNCYVWFLVAAAEAQGPCLGRLGTRSAAARPRLPRAWLIMGSSYLSYSHGFGPPPRRAILKSHGRRGGAVLTKEGLAQVMQFVAKRWTDMSRDADGRAMSTLPGRFWMNSVGGRAGNGRWVTALMYTESEEDAEALKAVLQRWQARGTSAQAEPDLIQIGNRNGDG